MQRTPTARSPIEEVEKSMLRIRVVMMILRKKKKT
jgi:hypothetical protein